MYVGSANVTPLSLLCPLYNVHLSNKSLIFVDFFAFHPPPPFPAVCHTHPEKNFFLIAHIEPCGFIVSTTIRPFFFKKKRIKYDFKTNSREFLLDPG